MSEIVSRILLVRHGQTEGNVAGVWQGQSDTPLTEHGLQQARRLGERLKGEAFDVAISSDLTRSVRTTALVLAHHPHLSPIYMEDVREHALGIFELRLRAVYEQAKREFEMAHPGQVFVPEGGESEDRFGARVRRVREMLLDQYRGKTVLVSAHGGFNTCFIAQACGFSLAEREALKQDSCCVNELVFRGRELDRARSVLNCTRHL